MRRITLAVLLVCVLLPGAMLAPAWRLAGLGAGEDDILYYYPTRVFFRDTIRAGQWPWLNPWTGLGRPFAADPQTAVWYPFTWLFVVLPPLWAYPVSLWVHYSLAIGGMYCLLRSVTLQRRAALYGGIAFAFCGFMLAHRAHFAMQHAAAWTPWVLWRFHCYVHVSGVSSAGRRRSTARLVAAGSLLALQSFAGHVQIAALTAAAALLFVVSRPAGNRAPRRGSARGRQAIGPRAVDWGRNLGRAVFRWLIACACAVGLFAVQWLPTVAYLSLCTRVDRTYRDFVENSWHPVAAVGLVLPMLLGQRTPNFFPQPYWGPSHQVELFAYTGLLPLLLAGLALRSGWRADGRRRPWVVLGLFGFLVALGQFGPLCPLLYCIPGSSLFRCPARAMLLVNLAVAALAAVTLHDLGVALTPRRARLRALAARWTRYPLILSGLLVILPALLVLAATPLLSADTRAATWRALRPTSPALWVPLAVAGVSLVSLAFVVRRWKQPALLWLLVIVTGVDLGIIGWTIDVPAGQHDPAALLQPRGPTDWMQMVAASTHRLWVVTGRHGRLPGEYVDPVDKAVANTNLLRRIATLTDYGPLQPRAVAGRFAFTPWGETAAAEALLTDTRWMRLYNVGWVLLCDDYWPAPADCELATVTSQGWRLYRNPSAAGWAVFEDAAQPGAASSTAATSSEFVALADTWPTRPEAEPAGPGAGATSAPRLIISHLHLPGWKVRVNDREVAGQTADGLLIAVPIRPGEAVTVRCSYFPPGLLAGAGVSLLTTATLIGCLLPQLRRPRRRR